MLRYKLSPLKNYFLVKERVAIQKVGNIVMPANILESSQNQITEGEIIALGPNAFESCRDDFPIGSIVKFIKYSGQAMVYNKIYYRLLLDDEVIAKLDHYLGLDEDLFY